MTTERVDLGDDQWAQVRTSYSWGQANRINGAALGRDGADFMLTLVRETVEGIHVRAEASEEWLDKPDAATWERMNGHAGEKLLGRCMDIWGEWTGREGPKDTDGPSSASSSG